MFKTEYNQLDSHNEQKVNKQLENLRINDELGGSIKKFAQPMRVIGVQEQSPIAWSVDGKRLAFVSGNASIYITKEDHLGNFVVENVLIGHKTTVNCLLFHPRDSILISGGFDGLIIWDYLKGFIIKRISPHQDPDAHESNVECLTWICDGTALVSGGKDANIKVWDYLKNFKLLETITGHKASVMCFAVVEHLLASAGRDSSVKLWDINTLRPESRAKREDDSSIKVHLLGSFDGHRGDVVSLAFNQDATMLFSGARDNEIKIWNTKAMELLRVIKHHKGDVSQVSLLNNDTILLSASIDGTLKSLKLGKQKIEGQESDVIVLDELKQDINNSPLNQNQMDLQLPIYSSISQKDDEKDKVLYNFEAHEGVGIADFELNPIYPLMATSAGHSVRIWRVSNNINNQQSPKGAGSGGMEIGIGAISPSSSSMSPFTQINNNNLQPSDKPILFHEFIGHKDSVNSVCILPEGDSFISGSSDYHIFHYNIKTMSKDFDFNFEGSVYTLCVGQKNDQRIVFAGGNHYDIKGYCINKEGPTSGKEVVRYQGHSGKVQALALNKDCSLLVSGGYDFDLFLWSVKMPFILRDESIVQKHLHKYSAHKGVITCASFSDSDEFLITSSTDHSLILWQVSNHSKKLTKHRTIEQAHNSVIPAVVFGRAQSASLYYSASWEGNIKVWDLSKKDKVIHEIPAFDCRVSSLTTSNDGKVLVASCSNGTIKTFSALSPFHQLSEYTPNDHVCTNSVSANDEIFVSSSENGLIRAWSLH